MLQFHRAGKPIQILASESVKGRGVFAFASWPPEDVGFLTTRLWDRHLPGWRKILADEKDRPPSSRERHEKLRKPFGFMKEFPSCPAGSFERRVVAGATAHSVSGGHYQEDQGRCQRNRHTLSGPRSLGGGDRDLGPPFGRKGQCGSRNRLDA